jgi:hypothetical protein
MIAMLVAAGAFPALAITNGTVDSVHANVGAVIFDQLSGRGRNFGPDQAARRSCGSWLARRVMRWSRSRRVKRQSNGLATSL